MTRPRFRFPPSPTGTPHIGNMRTALFNWALSRALKGDLIIRIEDTDTARNQPGAAEQMLADLAWLGLDWDEGPDIGGDYGPYWQSQRQERHLAVAEQLLVAGHAYYGAEPGQAGEPAGQPLRLRLPADKQFRVVDALHGEIVVDLTLREDPVLIRSDGRPVYHLATMVDDYEMAISHVVRGDDWLPWLPIHAYLYRVLGWPEPVWVHLPLVRGQDGQKLSKRDLTTGPYTVAALRAAGYLPKAVFNYLLLLGWSPDGEQEIVDKWEVRQQFRLERLSRSPSRFDWDKLAWVNRHYLGKLAESELIELVRPYLEDAYGETPAGGAFLPQLVRTIRPGLDKLADAPALAEWAFVRPADFSEAAGKVLRAEPAGPILLQLIARSASLVILDVDSAAGLLHNLRVALSDQYGWRTGQILRPIRAALTGNLEGPPLPEIMGILGQAECLERLAAALKWRREPGE
ncbi:MAG: glutamate--tRNA ligase [Anaerolineales bacterium]|nr:glutamate--tRNA ligase [Anaerolineales bacterium]